MVQFAGLNCYLWRGNHCRKRLNIQYTVINVHYNHYCRCYLHYNYYDHYHHHPLISNKYIYGRDCIVIGGFIVSFWQICSQMCNSRNIIIRIIRYLTSYFLVQKTLCIAWYLIYLIYRQISDIIRTLMGNKIVDRSDVVGASPVGAAPIKSSFST